MTYNFEDSAVRKEAKRLHLIRRIDARPLTEDEEAMATAFGKWDYQQKKESLTPAQKEAMRKKVRDIARAKKALPENFGKLECTALKNRVKAKAKDGRVMGFNLTPEYIQKVFDECKGKCTLTGLDFNMELGTKKKRNPYRPSVDRISSSTFRNKKFFWWYVFNNHTTIFFSAFYFNFVFTSNILEYLTCHWVSDFVNFFFCFLCYDL